MERPLIKGLAEKAVNSGFAVLRFDWSYFSNKGNPSKDGSAEFKDIACMLNLARSNPKIDSTRIYIAGKSMGSLLAYAAFNEDKSLKGCILLTPILSTAAEGDLYYPGLNKEIRPVVFILGDKDTDNCPVKELYQYLGTCETAFPVDVLAGGHSFEMGYDDTNLELLKTNEYNVNAAIDTALFWLKTLENRR
jgi:dienelactone hydrolase